MTKRTGTGAPTGTARAAVAAAAACVAAAAWAQGPDRVTVEVSECVELEAPEERLACFEARVDAALQEDAEAPTAGPRGAAAETGTASPGVQRAPARGEPAAEASHDEPARGDAESVSGIAALREREPNSYLITLENGQVWRQTLPKRYRLQVGDEVRVYRSRWGSFRLASDRLGSFIRVERVR